MTVKSSLTMGLGETLRKETLQMSEIFQLDSLCVLKKHTKIMLCVVDDDKFQPKVNNNFSLSNLLTDGVLLAISLSIRRL